MSGKYYAVVSGRQPGVYRTWSSAESQVRGFKGAIFKSFPTLEDAQEFIAKSSSSKISETPSSLSLTNKHIIYTDGSFAENAGGFGIVIITPSGSRITAHGRVPNPATNNIAELYAIYMALGLVSDPSVIYTDSQYSISCLTTFIHVWMKRGWNGVANRELLEKIYERMRGRELNFQHVQAHTGQIENEQADRLANSGRLCGTRLVLTKDGEYLENVEIF